jgi:hypothetical protein
MDQTSTLDLKVRQQVYDTSIRRGYPPSISDLASGLDITLEQARAALQRLAAGHVLVLQPASGEVLMANPFSAVPTPFLVELPKYACYGNCIWDALGIAAMLGQDAQIKTACGDCGLALELRIANGQVQGEPSVIHFAMPAQNWWDDIVFN